ncbi:MAG: transcription termination/antitermination protein NusG [Candidatus Lambdaproteobacteria bacterium]|jgi:transcriptional antiterminator NusG|nr:transcription termination/antitermination protein NusG [Candidatus Lambdaproteobacteria bacterium]
MVEEQTGTDMIFEEQEKNSETQEIILDDPEGNLPEESNLDPEVQENAQEINEADPEVQENAQEINEDDPGEHDNTGETEKVENVESSVETENQTEETEETESQVAEKPQNPNAKWYILQAYSGYEGRVEQTIREKLRIKGIEHLVDEIFIPSEDIIRTKEGKKRKVNQKYFPGYVLIHMELTPELWHLLMDVNRVSGFIGGTPQKPLPLDEKELEEIRSQVNEGFQQKATEDEFSVGQKVTIIEGSFGNFSGTIDEVNLERRKLKVLVSIFGRPTPVEVEFENVKHVVE